MFEDLELPHLDITQLKTRRAFQERPRRLPHRRRADQPQHRALAEARAGAPHRAERRRPRANCANWRRSSSSPATTPRRRASRSGRASRSCASASPGCRSSTPSTCASPPSPSSPCPSTPGGDVLPDGRLGLDGPAAQGHRQALLHPAVPVPQQELRERAGGLHPPPHAGQGSRRAGVLPLAGDRRHRGLERAAPARRDHPRALLAGAVEHLRGAGLRRRQLARRLADLPGPARQPHPALRALLRLYRDRRAAAGAVAALRGAARRRTPISRRGGSCEAEDIYPVSANCSGSSPHEPHAPRRRLGVDLRPDRRVLRAHRADRGGIRPRHLSQPDRGHHLRADDRRLRAHRHADRLPPLVLRQALRRQRAAATSAARWGSPTRS